MIIDTINIDSYIESLNVEQVARNQTKQNNLLGDYIIDRGVLKYKISLTLNLLTSSEWGALKEKMKSSFFSVTFDDDTLGQITRQFTCDSFPSPRLLKTPTQSYYKQISLTLEEM